MIQTSVLNPRLWGFGWTVLKWDNMQKIHDNHSKRWLLLHGNCLVYWSILTNFIRVCDEQLERLVLSWQTSTDSGYTSSRSVFASFTLSRDSQKAYLGPRAVPFGKRRKSWRDSFLRQVLINHYTFMNLNVWKVSQAPFKSQFVLRSKRNQHGSPKD